MKVHKFELRIVYQVQETTCAIVTQWYTNKTSDLTTKDLLFASLRKIMTSELQHDLV